MQSKERKGLLLFGDKPQRERERVCVQLGYLQLKRYERPSSPLIKEVLRYLLLYPYFSHRSLLISSKDPNFSGRTHLSVSPFKLDNSQFLGNSLVFEERNGSFSGKFRKTHLPFEPVRAAGVKWRKERTFDNVIDRDKKLKLVMKIRKILVNQPNRILSLRELGKFRRELGLTKKRRFIALLKKFPAVFEIVEEGVYSLQFRLTPEAERLYLEELKVRNEMEDLLVLKLRKLLMMSMEKRILLEKIAHLRTDFGLPFEFRDTICHRYPQYFRVVATGRGPALELTHWDPELAVSAAELAEEENRAKELQEKDLIIDRPLKFNRVKLPKGLQLSKSEMRRVCQFRDIPYISPYSDFSHLRSGSKEKEKHARGVVHEILSLTAEKRTLGNRDSVFLREAYCDSHLVEKDRLLLIKEKLRALVTVPRFPRRGSLKTDSVGGEDGTSGQEDGIVEKAQDWSDNDSYLSGDESNDDEHDGYEDDWSDEDDDIPPDFEDDDDGTMRIRLSKSISQPDAVTNDKEKVLTPVFPDGRPRELW
ncbi:PROTEIN WHAT'S THIS FACTOR 1-like protein CHLOROPLASTIC [Salix viminalis]|uniref:PROTEIN WHAT'S THIS FACTOR 1-like protein CHLOROPLASTIC n=1 Tax=Salix viminalis TaxID=40686 RepID=A0A9Q0UGS8_SALVM|nr:PROTEIN WHAT'S THIS FACTOR 1-like protein CHLOROPLASTIC [Salix viminalis]